MSLPFHTGLANKQIEFIVETMKDVATTWAPARRLTEMIVIQDKEYERFIGGEFRFCQRKR
ncbi:hypothetical protein ACM42_02825 [Bradyrhizobium sp. CCBAU 25338]|nr:hypothetical protein [Bradyrhizobium sp. CCBAU 45389]MDA9527384.1 hypothetical protein [Bradyrhizobium sp. CCBAU 25338]RXH36752.1 hypothetical protein XH84_00140 [Bradyrhizobium nanningense]